MAVSIGYVIWLRSNAISSGKWQAIAPLSAQEESALHLVGELYKLGMTIEEDLCWIKKEFVSVWKEGYLY